MSDLILYASEDGKSRLQLRAKDQTVWLSQREMAELFDVSTDNVGLHLKNLFEDGELSREATTEESSVVQMEGTPEVQRVIESCQTTGCDAEHHFRGVTKMVELGSRAKAHRRLPQFPGRPAHRRNPKARRAQDAQERADAAAFPIPGRRMKDGCFNHLTLP